MICVTTQGEGLTRDQVEGAAHTLTLLADPTRVSVLWALLHGEHAVNDLADGARAHPAAGSQHPAELRLSRLVSSRSEGTSVYYRAHNEHVRRRIDEALFNADHAVSGTPDHEEPAVVGAASRRTP